MDGDGGRREMVRGRFGSSRGQRVENPRWTERWRGVLRHIPQHTTLRPPCVPLALSGYGYELRSSSCTSTARRPYGIPARAVWYCVGRRSHVRREEVAQLCSRSRRHDIADATEGGTAAASRGRRRHGANVEDTRRRSTTAVPSSCASAASPNSRPRTRRRRKLRRRRRRRPGPSRGRTVQEQ